ncbi:MAG: C25 family cysteine peptidase [Candidatus Eisenbacteria bacterium]
MNPLIRPVYETRRALQPRLRVLGTAIVITHFVAPPLLAGSISADLRFDERSVSVEQDDRFHQISMDYCEPDTRPDHVYEPQLPLRSLFLVLPENAVVQSARLKIAETHVFKGAYIPLPILPDSVETLPDGPTWSHEGFFPANPAQVIGCGSYRGYQIAKILVSPLSYDASTGALALAKSATLTLEYREQSVDERRARLSLARLGARDGPYGEFRVGLRSRLANPGDLDRLYPRPNLPDLVESAIDSGLTQGRSSDPFGGFISAWPSAEGLPVYCVIVTNNYDHLGNYVGDMKSVFASYASARTYHGVTTVVATVDEIVANPAYASSDQAFAIRKYIRDAVDEWGTLYVILGGDISVVPTRRLGQIVGNHSLNNYKRPDHPADSWYVRFSHESQETWNEDSDQWLGEDQNDFESPALSFGQAMLGRLPARNADEAWAMTTKLERYQLWRGPRDNAGQTWYRSALMAAGPTNSARTRSDGSGLYIAEKYVDSLLTSHPSIPWSRLKLYPEMDSLSVNDCSCYQYLHDWTRSRAGTVEAWTGTKFRDRLQDGYHLVFHYEHSQRDRLGRATMRYGPDPRPANCSISDADTCRTRMDTRFSATVSHLDINQVLALDNGVDRAKFSVVISGGSWTNMQDMDAIGEAFLRAPDGGAVAFLGKTTTWGPISTALVDSVIEYSFFPRSGETKTLPLGIGWGIGVEGTAGPSFAAVALSIAAPLLADPLLRPHYREPQPVTITSSPSTIPTLGIQNLAVTVRDSVTAVPIEGALVCLRQGRLLYARTLTSAAGVASFRGILIQDRSESLLVSVEPPEGYRKTVQVPINATTPAVAYRSHEVDDCVTGDCDQVLEILEGADLHVRLKNAGGQSSGAGTIKLLPTPTVDFALKINGEYRPAAIAVGSAGALPNSDTDVFRVPFTAEGIRAEGTPPNYVDLTSRFRVWRDDVTGSYVISARSPAQSADTVFTGTVVAEARFTNVVSSIESNDSVHAFADSIWFQFRGDASADQLSFSTDAPDWLTLSAPSQSIGVLAPGDSTDVVFPVTLLKDVPSGQPLVFTLTHSPTWGLPLRSRSSFVVATAKPISSIAVINRSWSSGACGNTWVWTPVVTNSGSCPADSVVMVLRGTAGAPTVVDSVSVVTDVNPGEFRDADPFVVCVSTPADTVGFEWVIIRKSYQRSNYVNEDTIEDNGGCNPPYESPKHLRLDLLEGGIRLSWDYMPTCSGFWVGYLDYDTQSVKTLHVAGGCAGASSPPCATSFLVRSINGQPLDHPGSTGYPNPYRFYVAGTRCNMRGPRVQAEDAYTWVTERAGWPKLLPEQSSCAPSVVDLSPYVAGQGSAILAATDKLYGWRADGTPLNPSGSAVLLDFGLTGDRSPDRRVSEAMAVGNWKSTPSGRVEIGLTIPYDSTYALELGNLGAGCCTAQKLWVKYPAARLSPVVGQILPSLNDGVLIVSGTSDNFIHAWRASTGASYPSSSGPVWQSVNGGGFHYKNVAIGYHTGTDTYDLVYGSRDGLLAAYAMENVIGPPYPRRLVVPINEGVSGYSMSTPAVGDVDGDGDNDIVVTTRYDAGGQGGIVVIDEESGSTTAERYDAGWRFRSKSTDFPPMGPSLADVDFDGDLDILVADLSERSTDTTQEFYPRECRLGVFKFDDGDLTSLWAADSIPATQRNDEAGTTGPDRAAVYPIGSPIVGDFDHGSATCKLDILTTYSNGAICAFEYDASQNTLRPKPGWPLLLTDVAREPVLAKLSPGQPAYSLVVQDVSGWLHVFDLPYVGAGASCSAPWPSYGGNNGNTRGTLSFGQSSRPPALQPATRLSVELLGAQPARGEVRISLRAPAGEAVRVEIVDVSGRSIRRVFDGNLPGGRGEVLWDRRMDNGARAPSGIYWCRVHSSGSEVHRRLLALR